MKKKLDYMKEVWKIQSDEVVIDIIRNKILLKLMTLKYIKSSDMEDLIDECFIETLIRFDEDKNINTVVSEVVFDIHDKYVKTYNMDEKIYDIINSNKNIFDELKKTTNILDMPTRIHVVATNLHMDDSIIQNVIDSIFNF